MNPRQAIRDADAALLRRAPILGRNDAVGATMFLGSLALIAVLSIGWLSGLVPLPLAIVGIALALSTLHELEHDLIHDFYLHHPVVRNGMLGVIWLAKGSLDPWTRGHMHRWHHIVSGQDEDIEERLIGLGRRWGPVRLLVTLWAPASLLYKPAVTRAVRARKAQGKPGPHEGAYRTPKPLLAVNIVLFTAPLWLLGLYVAGHGWTVALLWLWVVPNVIRHATIVTMSSNSHYVGIERGRIVQQNQILDHWMFWPLQVFCWNFGATHVLHHFVVKQPFWRRTLVFPHVRQALIDAGVPANDLGTFARANRRAA